MCALYPEVMPPGLMPAQLPDAGGQGALLMQNYCTQCHELPGPGRHTAEEWPQVLDRMLVIMDVADRFGGLLDTRVVGWVISNEPEHIYGTFGSAHNGNGRFQFLGRKVRWHRPNSCRWHPMARMTTHHRRTHRGNGCYRWYYA